MSTPLRVLLIEDNADDAQLMVDALSEAGYAVAWERVDTADAMRAALDRAPWDAVLCDYTMPHLDALGALAVLRATGLDLPFIIVSGTVGEEVAVDAMRSGAHDYVMKDRLLRLPATVTRELGDAAERRERRALETKLREEEARFRALVEKSSEAVSVLNEQARLVYASPSTARVMGYDPEVIIGRSVFDFALADEIPAAKAVVSKVTKTPGATMNVEFHGIRRDGAIRWLDLVVTNLLDVPSVHGVVINYHDVTERKEAEVRLQHEQEMFNVLATTIPDLIYFKDRQSRFVRINEAMARFFGLPTAADALGKTDFDFFASEHAQKAYDDEQRVISTGEPIVGLEEKETWPDGRITWASTTKIPWHDAAGNIIGIVGISRNITTRKEAEEALRRSEKYFHALTEESLDIVTVLGRDGAIKYQSSSIERVLGWPAHDMIGRDGFERIHPDDRPRLKHLLAEFLEDIGGFKSTTYRYPHRDGRWHTIEGIARNLLHDPDIAGIVLNGRDVTERVQREEQLNLLNTALLAAPNCVVITDERGAIEWVNPAFTQTTGYTAAEVLGQNSRFLKFGQQSAEFYAELWRTVTSGRHWHGEFVNKRKDGSLYTEESTIAPVRDTNGAIRHFVAIAQDITPRKQAEAALRESEGRFRALASNTACGIVIYRGNRFCYANPAFQAITGYSEAELLNGTFWDVVHPEMRELVRTRGLDRQAGKDVPHRYEIKLLTRTGEERWTEFIDGPIEFDGQPAMLGTMLDITARKEAEHRLREQAELIDKANEAIVVSDLDNRITFWSRGAERLSGWMAAEVVGRPMIDLFAALEIAADAGIRVVLTKLTDWRGETRIRNRAGVSITLATSVTVLRDESGRPTGRLGINADITETKSLEERFLRVQRIESIGMLATGIAHDLNNVLAPIGMAVPMLRINATAPGDRRLLDTLEKCGERGAGLVRQILSFAHGIAGEPRLVQVKHLLRDVMGVITETFPKSIVLEDRVPNDLWPVMANPTQIHQILLNLCVNARDAMPDGGTMRLCAENCVLDATAAEALENGRPGPWLVLHVEDTGTGIPPEILAHIWEPFFTTKTADKGTGLGLSTVRGIVETHHGFVTVQTEQNRGTTFRVYLPAAESAVPGDERISARPPANGYGEFVLVVDDEAAIRDGASALLTAAGYRVATAADGAEAAELFSRTENFDLIITDLDMPNVDGRALARVIHAIRPETKILTMSGLGSGGLRADPVEFSAGFLHKPFSAETLLASVARLLHGASATT